MRENRKYDAACRTVSQSARLLRLMHQQNIRLEPLSVYRLLITSGYRYNAKHQVWRYHTLKQRN